MFVRALYVCMYVCMYARARAYVCVRTYVYESNAGQGGRRGGGDCFLVRGAWTTLRTLQQPAIANPRRFAERFECKLYVSSRRAAPSAPWEWTGDPGLISRHLLVKS